MFSIKVFGHLFIFINRKEEKNMAVIYVALIVKGKRTFTSVPETIKPQVREILIDLELENLISE